MTTILLDTQALLWLLDDSPRMGEQARAHVEAATAVHFSAASLWEIEIKRALGKLAISGDLASALAASGLTELPVTGAHVLGISRVELTHRDPFDRMLLSQARAERMAFLTADAALLALDDNTIIDARQ